MVNLCKQGFTNLQQEIIRLLFVKAGEFLNQRQLSKKLNVSQPAVKKALLKLDELEVINISQDKESKRWAIGLNRENNRLMQLKRVDNLRRIYESGLLDFLEKEFPGAAIILFGSFSRGDDVLDSDIDIAIIGRKTKKIDLDSYEKVIEREIIINFYESFSKIHKNLKESIFNGIVLSGRIEL